VSYKITRINESYVYEAPGHFGCLTTRLHDPQDVNEGGLIMGLTHFLPGGGTDLGNNMMESIYYIIEGEMTLTTDDGDTVLRAGDSFHCGPGTNKCVKNTGTTSAQMLVALTAPKK
jgi:quercetin dioxygenase-like cupin family protein